MQQKIINLRDNLLEIYIGYKNLILYKLNRFEEEDTIEYQRKKKLCTKTCSLKSSILGVEYCDLKKESDGEYGCGCIIAAKLWSNSPCPLGKF